MADLFTVSYGEILWDSYENSTERILIMATLASQSKEMLGLAATDGLAEFEMQKNQLLFPKPDIRLFKAKSDDARGWQLVDYDDRLPGDKITLKDWVREYESVLESDVVKKALEAKMPVLRAGFLAEIARRLAAEEGQNQALHHQKS